MHTLPCDGVATSSVDDSELYATARGIEAEGGNQSELNPGWRSKLCSSPVRRHGAEKSGVEPRERKKTVTALLRGSTKVRKIILESRRISASHAGVHFFLYCLCSSSLTGRRPSTRDCTNGFVAPLPTPFTERRRSGFAASRPRDGATLHFTLILRCINSVIVDFVATPSDGTHKSN